MIRTGRINSGIKLPTDKRGVLFMHKLSAQVVDSVAELSHTLEKSTIRQKAYVSQPNR